MSENCGRRSTNILFIEQKVDSFNTKIIFDNNKEIIVPCSYRTIENQISRASRLDYILRMRKSR